MRFIKNFIYNSFYQIIMVIVPLITAPYISRVLGDDNSGIYSYTYSIAYFFVIVSMLGLNNYGNRLISMVKNDKDELNRAFTEIYIFQMLFSSIITILYIMYVFLWGGTDKNILWIQLLYVCSAIFDVTWVLSGLEEFKTISIRNSIIKIITMILIFVLIRQKEDLVLYTVLLSSSYLLSQLSIWPILLKRVRFVKVHYKNVFHHIKPNLILFIPLLATTLYRVMDKVMIGAFVEKKNVSYYDYADKLINVGLGFSSALTSVAMPRISNMIAIGEDSQRIEKFSNVIIELATLIVCALAFGLASISSNFVILFYGEQYGETGFILKILCISMIFMAWSNAIRTVYIIPYKKDIYYVIAVCIGALSNLILNLIFIPKFGVRGALIGTLFAEAFVAIFQSIAIKNKSILKSIIRCIPYLIIGGSMFVIIVLLNNFVFVTNSWKNCIISILIGAVYYLLFTIIYSVFSKNFIYSLIKEKRLF